MYRIIGWCPVQEMNGAGFAIALNQKVKDAVKKSGITQERVDYWINTSGRKYILNHGYDLNEKMPISYYLRIEWGEWGIEHITVPGNACGLDIDHRSVSLKNDEVALQPHNVDNLRQASLILAVFTAFMEILESFND